LEWNVDPTEIQIEDLIYEGRQAAIYKGYWQEQPCAIKVPRVERDITDQELQNIRHEIGLIRKLSHSNIASLLCASIAVGWNSCYVLNYETNGSLEDLLLDDAEDISPHDAIQYLHENKPYCLHGNLKTSNILVQQDGNLVISDYGFKKSIFNSRIYDPNTFYNPQWLAPELLLGTNLEDDRPTDVYAYGLVLFSIITRQELFPEIKPMLLGYKIALEKQTPVIPNFIPDQLVRDINIVNIVAASMASPTSL
jgi:serine/threonine protein kinase